MGTHEDTTDYAAIARAMGDELRRLREAKGWSPARLADRLPGHLDADAVRLLEIGAHDLRPVHFVALCEALGETMHSVLQRALDRVQSGEDGHRPA